MPHPFSPSALLDPSPLLLPHRHLGDLTPSKIQATSSDSGELLPVFPPRLLERSARMAGSVATKLPTDADALLASADNTPSLPARVDKLAFPRWLGRSVSRSGKHPSS